MNNQMAAQQAHFNPIKRTWLTEDELNAPVNVQKIKVWGKYTTRGEHRKEVIERDFDEEIIVPEGFNKGHVKLCVNRHVKDVLKGIRARTFYYDEKAKPEKVKDEKRKVRDFISDGGIRENDRAKRAYEREIANRRASQEAMAAGAAPPAFQDETVYGADGLPKFSDRLYVG